jgi:hypothetical protein
VHTLLQQHHHKKAGMPSQPVALSERLQSFVGRITARARRSLAPFARFRSTNNQLDQEAELKSRICVAVSGE